MERNHTSGTDGKPAGCLETGARTASGCHGNQGAWRAERTRASLPLPRFEHAPIDMSAWPKGRARREETLYFCVRGANFHKRKTWRHKPKCVKGCVTKRGKVNRLVMLKTQQNIKLCGLHRLTDAVTFCLLEIYPKAVFTPCCSNTALVSVDC